MSFPRGFTFIQLRRFQYQMAITKLEDRLISDDLPVTRPCLLKGGGGFIGLGDNAIFLPKRYILLRSSFGRLSSQFGRIFQLRWSYFGRLFHLK